MKTLKDSAYVLAILVLVTGLAGVIFAQVTDGKICVWGGQPVAWPV